jgi:hypothetical protein
MRGSANPEQHATENFQAMQTLIASIRRSANQ